MAPPPKPKKVPPSKEEIEGRGAAKRAETKRLLEEQGIIVYSDASDDSLSLRRAADPFLAQAQAAGTMGPVTNVEDVSRAIEALSTDNPRAASAPATEPETEASALGGDDYYGSEYDRSRSPSLGLGEDAPTTGGAVEGLTYESDDSRGQHPNLTLVEPETGPRLEDNASALVLYNTAGTVENTPAATSIVDLSLECFNCVALPDGNGGLYEHRGHVTKDCTRNIGLDGYIRACPICNTRQHDLTTCPHPRSARDVYHFVVERRDGKPPFRVHWDMRDVFYTRWMSVANGRPRPQTPEFALRYRAHPQPPLGPPVRDPIWERMNIDDIPWRTLFPWTGRTHGLNEAPDPTWRTVKQPAKGGPYLPKVAASSTVASSQALGNDDTAVADSKRYTIPASRVTVNSQATSTAQGAKSNKRGREDDDEDGLHIGGAAQLSKSRKRKNRKARNRDWSGSQYPEYTPPAPLLPAPTHEVDYGYEAVGQLAWTDSDVELQFLMEKKEVEAKERMAKVDFESQRQHLRVKEDLWRLKKALGAQFGVAPGHPASFHSRPQEGAQDRVAFEARTFGHAPQQRQQQYRGLESRVTGPQQQQQQQRQHGVGAFGAQPARPQPPQRQHYTERWVSQQQGPPRPPAHQEPALGGYDEEDTRSRVGGRGRGRGGGRGRGQGRGRGRGGEGGGGRGF